MKRQYLGDARDAFKWEYQDFLVRHLGYPALQIVPMLTDDDHTNDGKTHPSRFRADAVFHDFCRRLKQSRSFDDSNGLPSVRCAAVYGHQVMFISISRSRSVIESVASANKAYAAARNLNVA